MAFVTAAPGFYSSRTAMLRLCPSHFQYRGTTRPKSKQVITALKDEEAEELMRIQREKLEKRRQGKALDGVEERRRAMREQMNAKEKPKEGEDPIEAWKRNREREGVKPIDANYYADQEGEGGGIPLPMASFGIPKYDQGERFDLRLPYVDQGYVDENDSDDVFKKMGKAFGGLFGKKKENEDESK